MKSLKSVVLWGAVAVLTVFGGLVSCAAEPGVLLWMADDPYINDHGTLTKMSDYQNADGLSVNAIRVSATDGGDPIFLDFYIEDEATKTFFLEKDNEYAVFDEGTSKAGPIWASLDEVAAHGVESYSFAIELGAFYEDASDPSGFAWQTLAVSDTKTYAELRDFISVSPADYASYTAWNPTTYAVPEPTGGLLILIGGALLALRRKEVRG